MQKSKPLKLRTRQKYHLYENSVQDPASDLHLVHDIAGRATGRPLFKLREDFCGTFQFSRAWVKQSRKHEALGLDLDPEPIAYGTQEALTELNPDERRRLKIRRSSVTLVTKEKFDLIWVGNFSFYIFKTREELIQYFKAALKSLAPQSAIVLEMAGGPGFIEPTVEKRTFKSPRLGRFRYLWEQKEFSPVTHHGEYRIHFEFGEKGAARKIRNAFIYDWRVWTVPEVRDALFEAGFTTVNTYTEKSQGDEGTGEYEVTREGDNDWAWISYLVAVRGVH